MVRRLFIICITFCLCWGLWAFVHVQDPPADLIFSHQSHAEMGFECLTCHGNVNESTSGKDNNLPDMDVCFTCHDGETATEECTYCHKDPDNATTYPRVETYHEMFAHANHLGRTDEDCSVCHFGVTEVDMATVANLPRMQVCMKCHQSDFSPSACEACHEDYKKLRPESHNNLWMSLHREDAKLNQAGCGDCHTPDYCQDCHQGENLEGQPHDLNYAYNHSLDARGKSFECMSCHESREFCTECHMQNMVMPVSHSSANWTNLIQGDGGQHKEDAKFDLESCAACHESSAGDPVCADCHVK